MTTRITRRLLWIATCFVLLPKVSAADLILPVGTNVDGGFVFQFEVVDPGQTLWLDPVVVIGYEFTVLSGPNVQSITLPNVGDGLFDIFDGAQNLLVSNWLAGIQFVFGAGGVSAFTITGIETTALIDPADPFIVGLTFAGPGQADLIMNPITTVIPDPVPEPATMLLFGTGLAGVAVRRGRQRRNP